MPTLTDLFGIVIPAQLDTPKQVTLTTEDGTQSVPAVITLRIDDNLDQLVADFLCIAYDDNQEQRAIEMLEAAFNHNSAIAIRFGPDNLGPSVLTAVIAYNLYAVAFGDQVRGRLLIYQRHVGSDSDQLNSAKLCLPDFPLFGGSNATATVETTYDLVPGWYSRRAVGHIELKADDWSITIAQRSEQSSLEYSHDVYIAKDNRTLFTGAELQELIDTISYFFTFVAGTIRWPSISVGYQSGQPVWGQFNRFKQNPYMEDNWFNPREGVSIATLFPLFWKHHSTAGDKLRRPVELYAESAAIAHRGLHQHALTVSHSALEHIAEAESPRQGRQPPAEVHIANVLRDIGISTGLSEFPDIRNLWTTKFNGTEAGAGPSFVTRLRNYVHAYPKNSSADSRDYYRAWSLSQYYVETALLKLCGYTGKYRNRMTSEWKTDLDTVPWVD